MPNIGPLELVIILAILLLLFGGARLAGLGKSTGRALREFKEETKGLKQEDADKQLPPAVQAEQQPYVQQPQQQPYAQPQQQPYAQPQQQPYAQQPYPQQPPANIQDPNTEARRDS